MNLDWKYRKLKEVCEIRPPKEEVRRKLQSTDLVTFLPMEDLNINQKYTTPTQSKILESVVKNYTYFAENDVLLAKITPCFENGKLGIAKKLINGVGFGSSEYLVFRPKEMLLSDFLYYFFRTEQFRNNNIKRMSGAVGHKRLDKLFIENYNIPIPPLSEQQRIADILDQSFAAIDQAIENTDKNLENSKLVFSNYLQSIFSKKNHGWKERKLSDIAFIKGGKRVPKGYKLRTSPTPHPYIRVTDFNDYGSVNLEDIHYIDDQIFEQIKRYTISTNDLYISIAGTIGKSGIIPKELDGANLTENACKLEFKTSINPKFIYYFTKSNLFLEQAGLNTRTAAMPKLALSRLGTIKLSLPLDLQEQNNYVEKIDEISKYIQKLQIYYNQKIDKLQELKQSILHKAFNGEL